MKVTTTSVMNILDFHLLHIWNFGIQLHVNDFKIEFTLLWPFKDLRALWSLSMETCVIPNIIWHSIPNQAYNRKLLFSIIYVDYQALIEIIHHFRLHNLLYGAQYSKFQKDSSRRELWFVKHWCKNRYCSYWNLTFTKRLPLPSIDIQ